MHFRTKVVNRNNICLKKIVATPMSDTTKDLRGLKAELLNVEKKITLLSIVKILAIYLKVRGRF